MNFKKASTSQHKVPTSYFNLGNKRVLHENTDCDKEIEEGTGENG